MSQLSALNSRPYQPSGLSTPTRQETGAGAKPAANGATGLMGRTAADAVSLSKNALDLSAQGMSQRSDALGGATVDAAQDFLASFAQRFLGDAAKGATLTFDSASVATEAGFSAQVQHSAGADGSTDTAGFSLNESSHFVGKGKITTADGQTFAFEIEVRYQSRIEAASSRTIGSSDATPDSRAGLPTAQLPDIDFPGSLGDLFKLLGQQLQTDVPDADQGKAGTLSLRLLNLVNHATLLDSLPTVQQADAKARAKSLADAYGAPGPALPEPAPAPPEPDAA